MELAKYGRVAEIGMGFNTEEGIGRGMRAHIDGSATKVCTKLTASVKTGERSTGIWRRERRDKCRGGNKGSAGGFGRGTDIAS